jgi:hypothetical protein
MDQWPVFVNTVRGFQFRKKRVNSLAIRLSGTVVNGDCVIFSHPYHLWLYSPLLDLGRFFSFLILYTVGRTPWTGDQPVAKPLRTNRTTQTRNKRTQTTVPRVGFEPTIPAFERAQTVHALDRAATVIGVTHN